MNNIYADMIPEDANQDRQELFFRLVEAPAGRSREQVWEALQSRLGDQPAGRSFRFPQYQVLIAAAAIALILLGILIVMRFYTITETSGHGQFLSCRLPDGSGVELNAGSELSYHPWWWRFSRSIEFEGEGYFEVEKGRSFLAVSDNGTTEVLGTSFTIYARADEYRVDCLTGKVRVASPAGQQAILIPGHTASIDIDGSITVSVPGTDHSAIPWTRGMFSFTARSLRLVLDEIERQYGVAITLNKDLDYRFTGYFSKEKPVEEVLEVVCKPFGLTFVKHTDQSYEILKN